MISTSTNRSLKTFVALLFVSCGVIAVAACAAPTTDQFQRRISTRATLASFRSAGITTVFEKRCGSLDCHGNVHRNLRIYSGGGLRLPNDAGLTVSIGDTTQDEVLTNYQSIMTLEPEQVNSVLDGDDPLTLLVLKKPLALERHKGGQTIRQGDDTTTCFLSWFKEGPGSPVDTQACTTAAIFPKE